MPTRRELLFSIAAVAILLLPAAFFSLRAQSGPSDRQFTARDYAGTWDFMLNGKPFATMVLKQNGDGFTGAITNCTLDMDNDGHITGATPGEGYTPIVSTSLMQNGLRIVQKDGDDETEWEMTLLSATRAEMRMAGENAPAVADAIALVKVQ
jgi:hypothetical protein